MQEFVYCLKNCTKFSGRARRCEYGMFQLYAGLISFVALLVLNGIGVSAKTVMICYSILCLCFFLPGLSVTVRRIHDVGESLCFVFIPFIPFFLPALPMVVKTPNKLNIVDYVIAFICFIIGILLLLYVQFLLFVRDGQPGDNKYGPNPKGVNKTDAP